METWTTSVNKILSKSDCVTIPRYQRRYSWDVETAHKLIRDIAEVATKSNSEEEKHWIGAVIYRELPKAQKCVHGRDDIQHTCREIIDGQQRLTTIRLWTLALLHHAESQGNRIEYELTDIWLQKPNDEEMQAIVDKVEVFERNDSLSLVYSYFRYLLWLGQEAILEPDAIKFPRKNLKGNSHEERWQRWVELNISGENAISRSAPADCEELLAASINDLSVLGIKLDGEEPVKVFEALNGNRVALGQFDHLRNFVFSKLETGSRDHLYDKFWAPAEELFQEVPVTSGVNTEKLMSIFLYEYLISIGEGKWGRFNAASSFSSFHRMYWSKRFLKFGSLETWISDRLELEVKIWRAQRSHQFAKIIHKGKELDLSLSAKRSLQRIRAVSDGPPSPLVMLILRSGLLPPGDSGFLSIEEVNSLLKKLEGFLFKSLLSEQSLTNFRAEVIRSMHRLNEALSVCELGEAHEIIATQIDKWDVYRWSKLRLDIEGWHRREKPIGVYDVLKPGPTLALLDVLDEELGSSRGSGFLKRPYEDREDPYWVEHIYPQSEKKWLKDLRSWGTEPTDIKRLLHSLGNLTALVSEINRDFSNKTFSDKKEKLNDSNMVPTKLNDWTKNEIWTGRQIEDRTHELLMKLVDRWPDPKSVE